MLASPDIAKMEIVDLLQAEEQFDDMLDRVARGESFMITRHGTPIGQLIPVSHLDQERLKAATEGLKAFSKGHKLEGDWKELRDAGRRW